MDLDVPNDLLSELYILEDKKPVRCHDVVIWSQWFFSHDRQVALTEIGESHVSTVFIGISFGQENPLLFETMAFDSEGKSTYSKRTATWEDALAAHNEIVVRVTEES